MNFNILRYDSIDSTNLEALRQARKGADEGSCIVARQQTAGRGRQGRMWTSPIDEGLYLSVVLRPKIEASALPLISLAAAVGVHDTLAELGLRPDIKWPNDILVNGKKISGILAETSESGRGLAVVVGIGINLTSASFPPDIKDVATSIENELGKSVPASELESTLLRHLAGLYEELAATNGSATILIKWSARSSYATGKNVRVSLPSESITGMTDGIEPDGAVRIRTDDGSVRIVHAGDVQRLRPSDETD